MTRHHCPKPARRVWPRLRAASALLVLASLLVGTSRPSAAADTPRYLVQDLGPFSAAAINDFGQVVGSATGADGALHAVLVSGGRVRDLGTLGGRESHAFGINDAGQVVGWSLTPGNRSQHAFRWQDDRMIDLGVLGGASSAAAGINAAGDVVGSSTLSDLSLFHAVVWREGKVDDLGTLGGALSSAGAINDFGAVAGASYGMGNTTIHAFLDADGALLDLSTLGGRYSQANGLNNLGWVVGSSSVLGDAVSHAFLSTPASRAAPGGGSMSDLGALRGTNSTALGVNDGAEVAGRYQLPSGGTHAFYWSPSDGAKDLNDLILPTNSLWELFEATGVSNGGQLVGNGMHDGRWVAFLATPLSTRALTADEAGAVKAAIERLRTTLVRSLDSQPLPDVSGSFLGKLQAAEAQLDMGQPPVIRKLIQSFALEIDAAPGLQPADRQDLVQQAEAIISQLGT